MITLAHMSDIHLAPLPPVKWTELVNKRITGYVNWRLRRQSTLAGDGLTNLVRHMKEQTPDFVAVTGDLVNLTEALETLATSDGSSLLDSLIERAVLLYKPADQPRPATTFVAAREPDLEPLMRGKPLTGLIPLSMFEREWLAVARLLPGGACPDFLRNRAEATQAPIQVAPKWTQRLDPYPDEASSQSSQNGGVLN